MIEHLLVLLAKNTYNGGDNGIYHLDEGGRRDCQFDSAEGASPGRGESLRQKNFHPTDLWRAPLATQGVTLRKKAAKVNSQVQGQR